MLTTLRRAARTLPASLLVLSGCNETPTSVFSETPAAAFASSQASFTAIPLLLRSPDAGGSRVWGQMLVFVGVLHPPNPCIETHELATVAVCGTILNPTGEVLLGGTLLIATSRDAEPVSLTFAAPPNPCLAYQVRGVAAPDLGATGLELPAVQIVFITENGEIVSIPIASGGARNAHWGALGPPNEPGTIVDATRGPPDAPPNPCLITLTGRAG